MLAVFLCLSFYHVPKHDFSRFSEVSIDSSENRRENTLFFCEENLCNVAKQAIVCSIYKPLCTFSNILTAAIAASKDGNPGFRVYEDFSSTPPLLALHFDSSSRFRGLYRPLEYEVQAEEAERTDPGGIPESVLDCGLAVGFNYRAQEIEGSSMLPRIFRDAERVNLERTLHASALGDIQVLEPHVQVLGCTPRLLEHPDS